jgi:hypothetical protein
MADAYAEAVNYLTDAVNGAICRAQEIGEISDKEAADELRRIADELEKEE